MVSSQFHEEELRKAEEGLVRAENLKMKDQRKDEELERKDGEVVILNALKDKLEEANLTLANKTESLEIELRSNKSIWEKQVAELRSLRDKDKEGKSVLFAQYSQVNVDLILLTTREIESKAFSSVAGGAFVETLKANASNDKRENTALRTELSSTNQQLQQEHEMSEMLLDKNKMLSETLACFNFKIAYSYTTKEKNKDSRTAEAIRAAYDAGELSVPCVRLQCTSFKKGLYNALKAAHLASPPSRPRLTAEKRRRDDGDHPARPRRLAPHEPHVTVPNNELSFQSPSAK
ncbi:hypothetical protein C0992_012331 [Termitomyces sp. T32_za158]|nr:hypothetical protein C0992_012331 [Termitomyces sp. T32_za158]